MKSSKGRANRRAARVKRRQMLKHANWVKGLNAQLAPYSPPSQRVLQNRPCEWPYLSQDRGPLSKEARGDMHIVVVVLHQAVWRLCLFPGARDCLIIASGKDELSGGPIFVQA